MSIKSLGYFLTILLTTQSAIALQDANPVPSDYSDWEPFAYKEFEEKGGKLVRLSAQSTQKMPFNEQKDIYVNIPNETEKDLCALGFDPRIKRGPYKWGPVLAVNQKYKEEWKPYILHDAIFSEPSEFLTVRIKPERAIKIKLDLDDFFAENNGYYSLYFHIFAPYCEEVDGKEIFEELPMDLVPRTPHPEEEKKSAFMDDRPFKYKKLQSGDWVTIEDTPGVLYVLKISVYINNDEIEGSR